jgi:hypothetical protein
MAVARSPPLPIDEPLPRDGTIRALIRAIRADHDREVG